MGVNRPFAFGVGSVAITAVPADDDCGLHALSLSLRDGSTAKLLRKRLVDFVEQNADTFMIQGTSLRDWVNPGHCMPA